MIRLLVYGYCGMGKCVCYAVDPDIYEVIGIVDDYFKFEGMKCFWSRLSEN